MRLAIKWGRLDGNHHGTPGVKPWDRAVRKLSLAIVPLGRGAYCRATGRRLIGRRLWLYGRTGACVYLDAWVMFERSPYRRGKYAPLG